MTIAGTRPEWIRQACIIQRLDRIADHKIVHTGQNYDFELSAIFFEELGIRRPDYFLEAAGPTASATIGNVIKGADEVLRREQPDAVVILGDTDSSFAALAAKKSCIPVFHLEAGNRCFDPNVPEETNRRIIDHASDFNLCYTEHARRNLLAEGLHPRRLFVVGSPLNEVLKRFEDDIARSSILDELGLRPKRYFLASFHRQENVENPGHLASILSALETLGERYAWPIVFSTHPRTQSKLRGLTEGRESNIRFLKPFGFFAYNKLQLEAACVLSDSGSIGEEAALLGIPAVTVRNACERPEALETGSLLISGLKPSAIHECVALAMQRAEENRKPSRPADYAIDDTSERVAAIVMGMAGLNDRWHGLDR